MNPDLDSNHPDNHRPLETLRLLERAARNRWAVSDEIRSAVPKILAKILADPSASNSAKCRAASVLERMDSSNLKALTEYHKAAHGELQRHAPENGGGPLLQLVLKTAGDSEGGQEETE